MAVEGYLLDLQRIVVRRLILFVGRGQKIRTRLGRPQIEFHGHQFVVAIGRRQRASQGHDTISILILRNRNSVLAWRAEPWEDDRQPNQSCRQRHRLKRAWLVASDRTRIPQVYRLGCNGQIRRCELPVHPIANERDGGNGDHGAEDHHGNECQFALARTILLPEDKNSAHARGTVCRVVDSRV